ncbi:MAG: hypothetical protein SWH68_12955 [Thermodesulfobacteriota bacterium]|nr:hypothetical protein [Thermodesulfobacteriota bacterium]
MNFENIPAIYHFFYHSNEDGPVKSRIWDGKVKSSRYGAALSLPRNEAYLAYAAMTRDAAQHRYWTFYEAVKFGAGIFSVFETRGGRIASYLTDEATKKTGKRTSQMVKLFCDEPLWPWRRPWPLPGFMTGGDLPGAKIPKTGQNRQYFWKDQFPCHPAIPANLDKFLFIFQYRIYASLTDHPVSPIGIG